jgi:phosphatidylinositol alpha-1,6-mannosyltransferase
VPDALLVTSSFLPGRGGIESYLAELCTRLAPRLAVYAPAKRDGEMLPEDLPYPVKGHPGSMLVPGPRTAHAIVSEAARLGLTKVLFGTPWPLVLTGPRLAAAGLSYGVVVHGAELSVPGALPLLRIRLARALARADLVLAVSEHTARATKRLIERAGLACPPLGLLRARVDLERFNPEVDTTALAARYGLSADDRVVLCLSRLVKRKGVHRLIDAFPEISARVPGALLVVAGTGPQQRRLRRLARANQARVLFVGRVDEADAPAWYARADVFVLPVADRWLGLEVEGLGVVLLEAAAAGTPCVTGRSGGTPEAVLDGRSGYVIDACDRSALIEATTRLLADPELARRLGAAGREHVRRAFSEAPLPSILVDWLGSDG